MNVLGFQSTLIVRHQLIPRTRVSYQDTRRVDNVEGFQNPPNCSRAFEPVNISQVATIPMVYQHSSWLSGKKDQRNGEQPPISGSIVGKRVLSKRRSSLPHEETIADRHSIY